MPPSQNDKTAGRCPELMGNERLELHNVEYFIDSFVRRLAGRTASSERVGAAHDAGVGGVRGTGGSTAGVGARAHATDHARVLDATGDDSTSVADGQVAAHTASVVGVAGLTRSEVRCARLCLRAAIESGGAGAVIEA